MTEDDWLEAAYEDRNGGDVEDDFDPGAECCDLCGETYTMLEVEHGNIGEFFSPRLPDDPSVVAHVTCAQSAGLEVA